MCREVLVVQVRSSVMCTPRNLVLLTLSTVELSLMVSGGWSTGFLLKSITTSFVLLKLRDRLLAPHHSANCATSSLLCVSSLLLMRPTTNVSSANLMMWFGAELGSAVVGQQREEQRAEHTALWGTCAQCGSARGVVADTDWLRSSG